MLVVFTFIAREALDSIRRRHSHSFTRFVCVHFSTSQYAGSILSQIFAPSLCIDPNMMSIDGPVPPYDDQQRPRVNLPKMPNFGSANCQNMAPNPVSSSPHESRPPVMRSGPKSASFSTVHVPEIAESRPLVNLPGHPPMPVSDLPNVTGQGSSNLEGHLRSMILNNSNSHQPKQIPNTDTRQRANQGQDVPGQSNLSKQQHHKRPNQTERRRQAVQTDSILASNQQSRAPINVRRLPSNQQPQAPNIPPHLLAVPQQILPPHLRSSLNNHQHTTISQAFDPRPVSQVGNNQFHRPPTQNRQLYNPGLNSMPPDSRRPTQNQAPKASVQFQIGCLDHLALQEVSKVEITSEEFEEKKHLRLHLEQVCRKAISEYEQNKNPRFIDNSIELKSFGSLSTTFATQSSDMDLILVSPLSEPPLTSPETELPRLVEKALLEMDYGARLLTRTRVSIIKFCEKPTPGLAKLLLEERVKWEKECDTPAKEKKHSKAKSTENGTDCSDRNKNVDSDRSDPMLPQNHPSSIFEADPHSLKTVSPSRPNSNKKAASKKKSPDVDMDNKQQDATGDIENSSAEMIRIPEINDVRNDISEQVKDKNPDKQNEKPKDKSPPPLDTEEHDPSLLSKTDQERVNLYKLAMQEGWFEKDEKIIIMKFIRAFENCHSRTTDNQQLEEARANLKTLPNVLGRYRAPPEPHPLDFPNSGVGIQCDINFSNHLALHNSLLLRCYSLCDKRVRKMVLFIKAWSKKRKINSSYHGTLSSYGYTLMVLHYLVNIAQPPVLPNLQRMREAFEDELSVKEKILDGYDIQFFRNEAAIMDLSERKLLTKNSESIGSLLRGFFHYFAEHGYHSPFGGFQWTHDTLSLRTTGGILPKQAKGWVGARTDTVELSGPGPQKKEIRQRYLFAIEDPFEIEHNIARTVVHNGIVAIRDEFRRAHRLIMNPGKEDLFAEAASKENLQYRAFGPRPRKDRNEGTNENNHKAGRTSGNIIRKVVGTEAS